MLTSVYIRAFTLALKGTPQAPGFEGCFACEQDGNMGIAQRGNGRMLGLDFPYISPHI
jgi:hypothetical protein